MLDPHASRPSFVLVASVIACIGACGGDPSPASTDKSVPKVESRVALETLNVPEHSAADMKARDVPRVATTTGTLQATLNGHPQNFDTLTIGANAAVWAPSTRVARVMIGGSQGTEQFPALRVVLEGVRLDTLELPATFSLGRPADAKLAVVPDDAEHPRTAPRPRIVYEIEARKIWETDPEGPLVGSVTIESFDGGRITGTFAAKLEPRSAAFGPPIDITAGTFAIDLRLNGITPRAAVPAASAAGTK
ncbi:MAG TPA: hypothetical protein VFG69_18635 [Nannocystaceae bacterium]|nr:hypothetical protein [Nannocystaceae bacterium]